MSVNYCTFKTLMTFSVNLLAYKPKQRAQRGLKAYKLHAWGTKQPILHRTTSLFFIVKLTSLKSCNQLH